MSILNNIFSAFERGSQDTITEVDELNQYARIEVEANNIEGSETQSVATNVSRFMNYRVTSRNAFYSRNEDNTTSQDGQTILVPESNRENEERFRNTIYSNFGRSRAVSARTNEDDVESRNNNFVDVGMNSNGFSTYGLQPNQSVAKYKLVHDTTSIGDRKLLDQESSSYRNVQSLLFFVVVVLLL